MFARQGDGLRRLWDRNILPLITPSHHLLIIHPPSCNGARKKGHGTPILRCAMTSILIRSRPCCFDLPVIVLSANPTDGLKPKLTIAGSLLPLQRAFREREAAITFAARGFLQGKFIIRELSVGCRHRCRRGFDISGSRCRGRGFVGRLTPHSVAAAARGDASAGRATAVNLPTEMPAMRPLQQTGVPAAATGIGRAAGIAASRCTAITAAMQAVMVHVRPIAPVRRLHIAIPQMIDTRRRVIAGSRRIDVSRGRPSPDVPRRQPIMHRCMRRDGRAGRGRHGGSDIQFIRRIPGGNRRDSRNP